MSATEPLVIVGAGGFAREAAAAVAAINSVEPRWELLGYLDDNDELHGASVGEHRILGPSKHVEELGTARVVVCTGSPANYGSRKSIVEQLALEPERMATLVHPAASIGAGTTIGPGTVILATTVTTTAVDIGAHVVVMPACVFTHEDRIGDYSTFGAGVRLAGGVAVGVGSYIGSGALVRENRSIGDWALIGMGAVVTLDVPAHEVWAGTPARRMRDATPNGPNERREH